MSKPNAYRLGKTLYKNLDPKKNAYYPETNTPVCFTEQQLIKMGAVPLTESKQTVEDLCHEEYQCYCFQGENCVCDCHKLESSNCTRFPNCNTFPCRDCHQTINQKKDKTMDCKHKHIEKGSVVLHDVCEDCGKNLTIQQLLDQRDEEIIGKLEEIRTWKPTKEKQPELIPLDQAISTIKEEMEPQGETMSNRNLITQSNQEGE